jgi:hypothetical protein
LTGSPDFPVPVGAAVLVAAGAAAPFDDDVALPEHPAAAENAIIAARISASFFFIIHPLFNFSIISLSAKAAH